MTGNPSIDKIILGLNGLFVTLAAGLVLYSHTMIDRPLTDQGSEVQGLLQNAIDQAEIAPVIFPKQVVNLYSRETRLRFLDLQLSLEVFEVNEREIIERYKPFILDALIEVTGNMTPAELNSVTGRILLESRLKNKINTTLGRPVLKKIYFSRFIIQ